MNYSVITKTAASILLVGVLAACGSSSNNDAATAVATPAAPTTFTIGGTAATGAVFANATVTIVGSDGTSYPATGQAAVVTGADGSYTITLPLTAKPPFVVQAARDDKTLVSVVAEAKDTNTNITPVTTLIASRLSSSGDPAKLADEIKNKTVTVDAAAVKAKVAEVVALIKPLTDAVSGSTTDPLNGKLVADGTGDDKVLDSLSINITPSSATSVNIEVSVKQKLADGTNPTVVAFTNTTAPAAALPTVTATDLVPSGTATLIADLLQRMTACYALAQTDRVAANGTAATDIKATACKDLFVGNDPTGFLNNGARVSSTGAWSSLFNANSAGVTFDRGSYEFTRANGDLVIAYRATDASANSTNNTLVVKADTDGKLRAIGNQYKYNGAVNAYQQLRNFINQPAADYYSSGYNLNVNNTADVASVVKIVVTAPNGKTLLLRPNGASSYFPLVKVNSTSGAETMTGTNFVRLARQYLDTANSGDPALADTSNFFSADRYTAADILAIPAQAKWKFEYYTSENTIDATQYYTTRARAMTIAELQTQPLANMADAFYADVKAVQTAATTTSGTTYYIAANPADPAQVSFDWVVPTGALAPTSIQVYGNYLPTGATTRSSFNDKTGVKSSARTATITCSSGGSKDTHCDSTGKYVATDRFNGMHLWAQDATGRDFAHFYAVYTVTIVP